MDQTNRILKASLLAEVCRLEADTRGALQRKNTILNTLEKHSDDHDIIMDNKNEEIRILKDKIVFFNKLFKSCLAHKREITELKDALEKKGFEIDMKENDVKELQDKIINDSKVNESLKAENKLLRANNTKLMETLHSNNEALEYQEGTIMKGNKEISDLEDELKSIQNVLSITNDSLKTESMNNGNDKQTIAAFEIKLKVMKDDNFELWEQCKANENKIKELEESLKDNHGQNIELNTIKERLETEKNEKNEWFIFKEIKLR
jgi:chromosome segregation ATPase